jgi:hypothetical protein
MPEVELIVHAGPHPRQNCPVRVDLPFAGKAGPRSVSLAIAAGDLIPAQICSPPSEAPAGRLAIAFMVPGLRQGESLRLTARFEGSALADMVAVRDDGAGSVAITTGGSLLTTYRYLGNPARPCFLPLIGPGGKRATRSWPVSDDVPCETRDHPHHRSLWVAHGDVNGSDNWSEGEGHGFQLHRKIIAAESGPVFGLLAAANDWTDRDQKKILEERRTLRGYALPGDARLFDFEVRLTATECDVRFGDTKEGGILAMRVAPAMDGDHGGRIQNSYGAVGEGECWGRQAQWCDYVGEIEGEKVGIAIFDHPQSFRHPTYWHVRDYGMYTANPFGWHDFRSDPAADGSYVLARGASLHFRYRVYLHLGSTEEAEVAARYQDYANPPRVEVVA